MIEHIGKALYWLVFVLFLPVIVIFWLAGVLGDVIDDEERE